ncbi:MAG: hypothetical protein Q9179_005319 [Wetmoreana sp. 5 TL-2023]
MSSFFEACADLGCSSAGDIGDECFAAVGNTTDPDKWRDSPQNAKKARDCICRSEYWSYMAQCRDCLVIKNLYPTGLPSDLLTPVPAMSTAYCSPADGRTDTKTINGWIDGATFGADMRLEPLTVIATATTVPSLAGPQPHPITGSAGAVQTDIDESVFDSLLSAASTETGYVSAIGQGSNTKTSGQTSSTATSSAIATASTVSATPRQARLELQAPPAQRPLARGVPHLKPAEE